MLEKKAAKGDCSEKKTIVRGLGVNDATLALSVDDTSTPHFSRQTVLSSTSRRHSSRARTRLSRPSAPHVDVRPSSTGAARYEALEGIARSPTVVERLVLRPEVFDLRREHFVAVSVPTPDRFPPSTSTMRADAEAKAPVADKLSAYLAVLKREAEVYGARPKVEIKCDFSYTLSLPASKVDRDIVTVPEAFAGAAVAPVKALARAVGAAPEEEGKNAITEFPVLQDVQCAFRPGEITLVLAPPGHGKTALLKAVAGCLPAGAVPDDAVTYGGLTKQELENRGVSVDRLCAYVEQVDTHLPFLTVRETAAFSHDNSCPSPPDTTEGRALHADKLEAVTSLLALEGCIDTIIGDDLVRGVSGGRKSA